MSAFAVDSMQGIHIGGGNFSKCGGAQVDVRKTMEDFFIKRFALTMNPILIVLFKHI